MARNDLLKELGGVDFFAGTADMWSSSGLTPYIGKYGALDWQGLEDAQPYTLGTWFLPEQHTAQNLAECMEDLLAHWNLDADKQVAITTDNGANIIKAVRDANWCGLSCFGHNLHLAITTTISKEANLQRAIRVCSKFVFSVGYEWR